MNKNNPSIAVWVITPGGCGIAGQIAEQSTGVTIYAGKNAGAQKGAHIFDSLAESVGLHFAKHDAHVFVMATGIALRMIAPWICSKHTDPAVICVDESGKFAVSLLSGHLGGANALAEKIARITGACPVITTATDCAGVPAIDMIAQQYNLEMQNPEAVKQVSMALVAQKRVLRYDPFHILDTALKNRSESVDVPSFAECPGIYVDYRTCRLPENVLVLRPAFLVVGLGCNSGTTAGELCTAVETVFEHNRMSVKSIRMFATIMQKVSEPGMQEMSRQFARRLKGFTRAELSEIKDLPTPSEVVEKHMGVKSVCEAAAILAARNGPLIIAKQKTRNTTLAVAALPCL